MKRWRDEYFHSCGFNAVSIWASEKILRHANTMQRAAEVECSVSQEETRAYWARREFSARKSIEAVLDGVNDGKPSTIVRATYGGDPRGCVVKLSGWRWVGVGALRHESVAWTIDVPGTGFTAAQMERLCRVSLVTL